MTDQKISDFVKQSLSAGRSKDEIYRDLLNQGLKLGVIEEAFGVASTEDERKDSQKRTIRIMVTIGALLIAAGVFSFVASNWQEMSRPLKIGVIIAGMLIAYLVGWYLREKRGLRKTGEACILLGALIYGAGIFLVAQMFNIRANWPDGFILWMFGAFVAGFAAESYLLYGLGIILGFVSVVGHPFGIFMGLALESFLFTSSILILAATALTFFLGRYIRKKIPAELKEFY